ncbi:hypothetical protein VSK91_17075 [Bacillus swezeyi]|uniref:hypothetical protein n=1 Tax=Bacillus swezeyi TaxID=1925020 RepID=UPI0039C75B50
MGTFLTKCILSLLTVTLVFSSIGYNTASASDKTTTSSNHLSDENFFHEDTYKLLESVENIPETVINQGTDSILDWLEKDSGLDLIVDGDIIKLNLEGSKYTYSDSNIQLAGFWGCTAAILAAVAGVGIPISKILKLKKALKAVGGVSKFVDKVLDLAAKYKRKGYGKAAALKKAIKKASSTLGKDLQNALLDLAGITAIIANCGGD